LAAVLVAAALVIGLGVFYGTKPTRVDGTPSTAIVSTEQTTIASSKAPTVSVPARKTEGIADVDPKAEERAAALTRLGFGTEGGHTVKITFTNSSSAIAKK